MARMRVLVLGGYGQIGASLVRALAGAGCEVVGLARSARLGARLVPQARWIGADIAALTAPAQWRDHLHGVDVVVNASGALQDGAKDNLAHVQRDAICALIGACEEAGVRRFVQISAPGASPDARLAFLRTKGEADARLRASGLAWIIFKPGLVIGPNAYGGTALVRMLAAVPFVQPLVFGAAPVQTVALSDVADAVRRAVTGDAPVRAEFDLVEEAPHSLGEIIALVRAWIGFPAARIHVNAPTWLGYAIARVADLAGWLGWRSPLRTTSLRAIEAGVIGDAAPWRGVTGARLMALEETLAALPSVMQERVFARAQLVFPLLVITLAGFWIASGIIGVARLDAAAGVLPAHVPTQNARALVLAGAGMDVAIGAGLIVRGWTRAAAWAGVGVSLIYLCAASALAPHLWLDPLGPLVKVFPAMALGVAVAGLAERR